MPRIDAVMLNKRLDELANLEKSDLAAWHPPHRRALEARRDHLRVLCRRGLERFYPGKDIDQMLQIAVWVNR
jgi:hypothetical protein